MDISSAFSKYASRKQLRRFAASLSLQADEPGSLASLLCLDRMRLRQAIKDSFKNSQECAVLQATIEEWMEHGPPKEIVQDVAVPGSEETTHVAPASPLTRPKTAPPQCCVECHARTPYVFKLLDCRLCASCERSKAKYTLMTLAVARSLHGLSESDLRGTRSMWLGDKCIFLRSDVENRANQTHGTCGAEVAALQKEASREWKQNSFSTDARGKTQKWKEWNSVTYQKKQSMRKQDCSDTAFDCMNLSGLVYAD